MALSDEDVREILRIIDETPLQELRVETEGFVLHVRKGATEDPASRTPATQGVQQAVSPVGSGERGRTRDEATILDRLLTIKSPMLGTFYRAEGPGQKPFVEVGAEVDPHTTVCIIEVMKMMNSVPAGVSGTIVEVCPQNAELVEYGAPLFRVRPA